jgi:hypothetical protein
LHCPKKVEKWGQVTIRIASFPASEYKALIATIAVKMYFLYKKIAADRNSATVGINR